MKVVEKDTATLYNKAGTFCSFGEQQLTKEPLDTESGNLMNPLVLSASINAAQQNGVFYAEDNNEAEALRSWRSALDQIHYHNVYRVPANYRTKSETEKALQESLRDMELQCKERVDVLEAVRQSQKESTGMGTPPRNAATARGRTSLPQMPRESSDQIASGEFGQGTTPTKYPDLSRPRPPPLPERPNIYKTKSSDLQANRSYSVPQAPPFEISSCDLPPSSAPSTKHTSRTPSPEKKSRLLTTLRPGKDGKRPSKSPRGLSSRRSGPPVASKAAGLAWDSVGRSGQRLGQSLANQGESTITLDSMRRESAGGEISSRPASVARTENETAPLGNARQPSPPDLLGLEDHARPSNYPIRNLDRQIQSSQVAHDDRLYQANLLVDLSSPVPPPHGYGEKATGIAKSRPRSPARPTPLADYPSYRKEYQPTPPSSKMVAQLSRRPLGPNQSASESSVPIRQRSPQRKAPPTAPDGVERRHVESASSARGAASRRVGKTSPASSDSADEYIKTFRDGSVHNGKAPRKAYKPPLANPSTTLLSRDLDSPEGPPVPKSWTERLAHIKKNLPKGVDENAAKQIFNEIVVQGDEVHWDDVAGLDVAKNALKEAVVYPFLRPDLFMGLREPARGMLLFGPPGTGKTMLARAVATESRSTFFAISASSLTSKYLGESEKLVRALFSLAKALAPSIIFVDEIDSLLSSRGGSSEHEATRRIKTEFLIQWSDLQRAAAGKVQTDKEKQEGDASRVLVLAATNLPWAIDEAARRRFVRRQYIPLPEGRVRETQLKTLLGHQKHNLNKQDIQVLVELTDGFSGSDITALAKDAAMGPLRSLGEALLHMRMDEIRPIQFEDFEASLVNIRPSVSKQGLKEFEDWAREFGERGG